MIARPLFLVFLAVSVAAAAQTYRTDTIAGSLSGGGYVDGQSSSARFSGPQSVAVGPSGVIYVADAGNHVIRAIAIDGTVSTLAGEAGVRGSSDGVGAAAHFYQPRGVAVGSDGTVYVADSYNHTIRSITPAGVVRTVAGSATNSGTADGNGSAARFSYPEGVAVDPGGNMYVADTSNHAIRRISSGGAVSTLVGLKRSAGSSDGFGSQAQFNFPFAVACDSAGNVFVADTDNHTIRKVTPEGHATTVAGTAGSAGSADGLGSTARFRYPWGLSVDRSGNVWVADTQNETIRKVAPDGTVTTFAGSTSSGALNGAGTAARFNHPSGIAVAATGMLYVADMDNEAIRSISIVGLVSTFAGSMPSSGTKDGATFSARFFYPWGVAVDSHGNIFIADSAHTIRRITADGIVSTFAGVASQPGSADGAGATARFNFPSALTIDANDNLYVADTENHTIRKVTAFAAVTTIAGVAGQSGKTDGSGSQARFNEPFGITIDNRGNLYVADSANHLIRMIDPAGVVTTFAGSSEGAYDGVGRNAQFDWPLSVAVDAARNIYVADWANDAVRKITQAGAVTTVAGSLGQAGSSDGVGQNARFNSPSAIAATANGTLFIADTDNHVIRQMSPTGTVTTIGGLAGSSGNVDGAGSSARFFFPSALAVDAVGHVVVADTNNHSVRVVSTAPPTITRFDVTPSSIAPGKFVTLNWSSRDAASASIDNGVGVVAVSGSRVVFPSVTTTYTLTVSGAGGTTTASVTVVVTAGHKRPAQH